MKNFHIYHVSRFLLILVIINLCCLHVEMNCQNEIPDSVSQSNWVYISDPEFGSAFYSCLPDERLEDVINRHWPQLTRSLTGSCQDIILDGAVAIELEMELGSEKRYCVISSLPERCNYFLGLPMNINKAPKEALCLLPGIGPRLADKILALRNRTGCFSSSEDLLEVPGIGKNLLGKIQKHLCFH